MVTQSAGHLRQLLAPFTDKAVESLLLREDPADNKAFITGLRGFRILPQQAVGGHICFGHGFFLSSVPAAFI